MTQRQDFQIDDAAVFDAQLKLEADAQVINVEDEANKVSADPASNGGAIDPQREGARGPLRRSRRISQQLQAMAGPGAALTAGRSTSMVSPAAISRRSPPSAKSASIRIRSRRSTTGPASGASRFSPSPARIHIRGQAFFQYNKEALNSRSPLLAQSQRPPYKQEFYGFNLGGPIKKQKASFGFDSNAATSPRTPSSWPPPSTAN